MQVKFVRYIVTQIIAMSESGVSNFHIILSLVGVQCLKTLHMNNKSDITVVYFSCHVKVYLFYCAKVHNSHASNTSKTGTHAITLGCDCNYNIFVAHCKLIYMQHHRTHDLQNGTLQQRRPKMSRKLPAVRGRMLVRTNKKYCTWRCCHKRRNKMLCRSEQTVRHYI